jgi:CRP/FNR family transcriptional regulator
MTTNQPPENDPRSLGHCLHCADKSPLFTLLQPEELELMNQGRHQVRYNPGEVIFKQGAPLTHVMSFNQGLAKIQLEGPDGSNVILRMVKPVEFICAMGLYSDNRNQFSLVALKRSSVCYIDKQNFKAVLSENTTFMEAFLKYLEDFQARNLNKLISLHQKHAVGRIAEALLYLTDDVYGQDTFEMDLSTQELAEMASLSRESAFKVLNEFSSQGLLTRNGHGFTIHDKALLRKYCLKG